MRNHRPTAQLILGVSRDDARQFLRRQLTRDLWHVDSYATVDQVQAALHRGTYQAGVFDWTMGAQVIPLVPQLTSVIMGCPGDVYEQLAALNGGALAYLHATHIPALSAQVHALLSWRGPQQRQAGAPRPIHMADLQIDFAGQVCQIEGQYLALWQPEWDVLYVLGHYPYHPMTHAMLATLGHPDKRRNYRAVHSLREKFQPFRTGRTLIQVSRRYGMRWCPPR